MPQPISTRSGKAAATASAGTALSLGGCDHVQSALTAAGGGGAEIAHLSWILFAGGGAILLIVVMATAVAIWAPARLRSRFGGSGLVIWGGVAFPVVVLSTLLIYGLGMTRGYVLPLSEEPLRIEVAGEMWWWRVRYLTEEGEVDFATANEVRLPADRPAEIVLTSDNVIHSFWIPALGGKLDMIPGHTNVLRLEPQVTGIYRGQCAEYCGAQHALMAFDVAVLSEEDFAEWRQGQRAEAREPRIPFVEEGRDLFHRTGCGACHTIRGTPADGTSGPDLTHVGGRLSIGAGTLPNNAGTLAAWISDSQHIKTGNPMPSFDMLEGRELRAIATYLEGLE